MCDIEFVIYKDGKLNIYDNNKLTRVINVNAIEDDIEILLLPNRKFIVDYNNKESKSESIICSFINDKIITSNFNIEGSPVIDGTFVTNETYIEIKLDNTINITHFDDTTIKYMPANIKSDVNDTQGNINNLLVVEDNTVRKYDSKNKVNIVKNNDTIILAWFDNKYVVTYDKTNYIIFYDITRKYDYNDNILKLDIIIDNLAYVMYVFGGDKLGKLDPVWNYVRTAYDGSIDIFLDDGISNVSIIHITPQRDIELEKYNLKEYKIVNSEDKDNIDMIVSIVGSDLGFTINNEDKVYFFDRYNKCLTLIADGTVNMFSDELYRKIRRYNISKIQELNPIYGIRKIISEYEI